TIPTAVPPRLRRRPLRPSPRRILTGLLTPARVDRVERTTPDVPDLDRSLAAVSYRSHAHGTGFVWGAAAGGGSTCGALCSVAGIARRGNGNRPLYRRRQFQCVHSLPRGATHHSRVICQRERGRITARGRRMGRSGTRGCVGRAVAPPERHPAGD